MFSLNPRVIKLFSGAYAAGTVIGVGIGSVIQQRKKSKEAEAHFQQTLDKINADIAKGEKDYDEMFNKEKEV